MMTWRPKSCVGAAAGALCLCAAALVLVFAARPAAATPPSIPVTVERAGPGGLLETVKFRWWPCWGCDFFQMRWGKLGGAEDQQRLPNSQIEWDTAVRWDEPGVTWVFKLQVCESGLTGSDCSGWVESRIIVPAPPSALQVSDASSWTTPMNYVGTVHLSWQAGVALDGVKVRQRGVTGVARLPGDATGMDVNIAVGGKGEFQVCGFVTKGRNDDYEVGCTLDGTVQVSLPSPRAPINVAASLLSKDEVRISFTRDNVAEHIELERLQVPPLAQQMVLRLPQEPTGATSSPAPGVNGPASAKRGVVTSPQVPRPVQPGPAVAPAPGPRTPYWVHVPEAMVESVSGSFPNFVLMDPVTKSAGAMSGSPHEPYTYRVCAVNHSGRACSEPVATKASPMHLVPLGTAPSNEPHGPVHPPIGSQKPPTAPPK